MGAVSHQSASTTEVLKPAEQLGLLASALAGRELRVEVSEDAGEAWTDGIVIHVPANLAFPLQLARIGVQSALLAAGSLEPGVIGQLNRRPALAQRYLAIEAARAIHILLPLMPTAMASSIDIRNPPSSGSADESLQLAKTHRSVDAPLPVFGSIRVKELLAAQPSEGGNQSQAGIMHQPAQQQAGLKVLTDEEDESSEDHFDPSSPVGGGGGIGKLLQNLFRMARRVGSGGQPGADAPTHWSRSGPRAGVTAVASSASTADVGEVFIEPSAWQYPEWNAHERCYRQDWCTVTEVQPERLNPASVEWLGGFQLRQPLSKLGLELERRRRQRQGDEIDIDAAIEAQAEMAAGSFPDESVYVDSQRHRRDLSVLVLLDISGSVAQASTVGLSVHEQQRKLSAELLTVLYELGDRTALYAFHSQGRTLVNLEPVKRFDEQLCGKVMEKLYSLKAGAYSRLGAAIRHGLAVLDREGGTANKVLLVLSDGLAYDHGYEAHYAAADVRKALEEARRFGMGCVCLSLGAHTDTRVLRNVFGAAAFARITNSNELGRMIGPLLRSALRAAALTRNAA